MNMEHTPGELKRFEASVQFIQIGNKTIGHIGGTLNPEENEANAERIVLTWNTHDALLAACRLSAEHMRNPEEHPATIQRALREAIAKVESASPNIPKLIVNEIGLDPEGGK